MSGLSPKLPLTISERDGAYELISDYTKLISQNLRTLILTNPGEKTMDPSFGVGIKMFLFENSIGLENKISARINNQVSIYMPFIEIEDIIPELISNENYLKLRIKFKIIPLESYSVLELEVKN